VTADARQAPPGRVLIVDDSASARKKLALAVRALGHETCSADGGEAALALLHAEPFDLVLLDVVMPGLDGLDVLTALREDERLREVPVIVVSGLENEPGTVTEAIRLGAVDFLPKAFESVLLRARIGAALRRKRNRDRELVELSDVRRLTEAAALLERTLVSAERLDIGHIAERDDALGRFASVFSGMAAGVHARERDLRRRLVARRGFALLLITGVLFGLSAPLSRIAMMHAPQPTGLALWVNAMTATACLSITAWRRRWPALDGPLVRFMLLWGLCGASLAEVMLFTVAERVPASTLSVIIVLESFIVFAIAALAGRERASARRLAGLLLGLLAMLVVVHTQGPGPGLASAAAPLPWMLLALIVPLCYAGEDLLLAFRMPAGLDLVAAVGLASLAGCALLLPAVLWFGDGIGLAAIGASAVLGATLVALTAASLVGTVLHARLVLSAGAVFGSQASYLITLAGIGWAMLLLGERPAPGVWTALVMLFVGLLLVEPKRASDDVLDIGVFDRQNRT